MSALRFYARVAAAVMYLGLASCVHAPSPLTPYRAGSVGTPSRGVLTGGVALPNAGPSWKRLRQNERRFAIPRFIEAIERAADAVASQREGSVLVVGDLSAPHGGQALPEHASHRTGRDVDLLLYLTTLDGAYVPSPGFLAVGADGLAFDKEQNRYLRFDVAREWLLVRHLVTDEASRVQWIFVHHNLRAMLLEWALAKNEPPWLIARAMDVMLQPHPGGPHDDHIHVRTACTDDEIATGCEPTGPARPWLERTGAAHAEVTLDNATLLRGLQEPEPQAQPADAP